MRAMILAAGRGERMGELTVTTPKPLLKVGGRRLIEHAILNLKKAGIVDIVINVSYQADQIKKILGYGQRYGVNIVYSEEPERLETGGGIHHALPLLGKDPFIVLSSDIVTDFPLAKLKQLPLVGSAHLILVANPSYHPQGDFGVEKGQVALSATPKLTFANLGLYDPKLFATCQPGHFRLADVLFPAIEAGKITGEQYQGVWYNIGRPEDIDAMSSYSC